MSVISRTARRITGRGLPRWVSALRWLVFLFVLGVVAGAIAFFALYKLIDIPDPNAAFQAQTTKVYFADGKHQIGNFATQNREDVDLKKIPVSMQAAAVAAEDRTFYTNRGIDVKGILRAARNNATSDSVQGGSTITQQYVKILYLNQERTLKRKVKEAILSIKIHNQLSKNDILQGYLNTIYFGNGAYGVEVASKTYFNKSASDLTIPESATLAAIINSPNYYDPFSKEGPKRLLNRYNYVLDGMAKSGAITSDDLAKYTDKLPKFTKPKRSDRFGGTNGFLLKLVQKKMKVLGFTDSQITGGGLNIVTTFGYKDQKAAVKAVNEIRPSGFKDVHTALVSVEPGTGAVRAMYGGPDYLKSQLNWATIGSQPGSAFKAFALVAGLRNGFSLKTLLDGNSPIKVGDGSVENEGVGNGRSYGTVQLKYATQESINTAFVDLTEKMKNGPKKIKKAAGDAGIPASVLKTMEPVPVISLGVERVPTVDMANGYATLAAGGKKAKWHVVESVKDSHDASLYKHKKSNRQTIPKDVVADTVSALESVVTSGTGANARTTCPTAGKTGTATAGSGKDQHVSSSWFVGFTPKLATAVMYNRGTGNERLNGYLPTYFGAQYPAKTFKAYMDSALQGTKCGKFPPPANLKATQGEVYTPPPPPPPRPSAPAPTTPEPTTPEPTTPEPTTPPPPTTEPPTEKCPPGTEGTPPNCKPKVPGPSSPGGDDGS